MFTQVITQRTVGVLGALGVRAALLAAQPGKNAGVVAETQVPNAKEGIVQGKIKKQNFVIILILWMEPGRTGAHGVDAACLVT